MLRRAADSFVAVVLGWLTLIAVGMSSGAGHVSTTAYVVVILAVAILLVVIWRPSRD